MQARDALLVRSTACKQGADPTFKLFLDQPQHFSQFEPRCWRQICVVEENDRRREGTSARRGVEWKARTTIARLYRGIRAPPFAAAGRAGGPASVRRLGASPPRATMGSTISVEGNIGVGKSTFLKLVGESERLRGKVVCVPEPIEKWQSVGGSEHNILGEFYKDPRRFAYAFQNYAFIALTLNHLNALEQHRNAARIFERTVYSNRNIFVSALRENDVLSSTEHAVYSEWFECIANSLPSLVPNLIVYLRASPEVCMERLRARAREAESPVPLEYLKQLHDKHERWLVGETIPARLSQDWRRKPLGVVGDAAGGGIAAGPCEVIVDGVEGGEGKELLPGVSLRIFGRQKRISDLANVPVMIVDCEKASEASEVGLDSFKFNSILNVLELCGITDGAIGERKL